MPLIVHEYFCYASDCSSSSFLPFFFGIFLSRAHAHARTQIVDSAVWSDAHDMIAALADQKLLVWYCPNVVYIDRDLLVRLMRARSRPPLTVCTMTEWLRVHICFAWQEHNVMDPVCSIDPT